MFRIARYGGLAAAVVVFAFLGTWLFVFDRGAGVALASVIENVKTAKTVRFKMTVRRPDGPEMSGEGVALSPNFVRVDWRVGEHTMVNIIDHAKGEVISLDPKSKQARVHKVPKSVDFDVVKRLRGLDDKQARRIEPEEGADPNLEVFEIREGGATGKMWVDKKAKLPVRYEMHGPENSGLGSVVFSDFDWNAQVDAAVFEIPAGYTRVVSELLAVPAEEQFVQALRIRHAFTDEPYPADFLKRQIGLDIGRAAYDSKLSREQNHVRQLERLAPITLANLGLTEEQAQDAAKLQQRIDFLCMKADQFAHLIERHGGWVGGGVKPGAADQPLCWWRPKGSDNVRVLYGDLLVRVAAKPPKAD